MKTTEKDVQMDVLKSLMELMNSKVLKSMKPEDEEVEDEEVEPVAGGLSISVIKGEDEEDDSVKAKLRKLFGKE